MSVSVDACALGGCAARLLLLLSPPPQLGTDRHRSSGSGSVVVISIHVFIRKDVWLYSYIRSCKKLFVSRHPSILNILSVVPVG